MASLPILGASSFVIRNGRIKRDCTGRLTAKALEDVLEYIVEIVPAGPASPATTAAWFAAQLNGAATKGLQFSGIVTINGTQMILYRKA